MKKTFTFCAVVLAVLLSFSVALSGTISLQELRDDIDALPASALTFASEYADLATAVSTIGATETTLIIDEAEAVTAHLTVPSTMEIWFLRGGDISVQTGSTVTIDGSFEAGFYKTFSGEGNIVFGMGGTVKAAWFGFDAAASGAINKAAILAAIASCSSSVYSAGDLGGEVLLHRGTFTIAADLVIVTRNITLSGAGPAFGYDGQVHPATTLEFEAGTSGIALGYDSGDHGGDAHFVTLRDLGIDGKEVLTDGIWVSGHSTIENVVVINCVNGVHLARFCNQANLKHVTVFGNSSYGILCDHTLNTVINLSYCNIRENDDVGLGILAGTGTSLDHCVIESNWGLGLYIYNQDVPENSQHFFNLCWFENNDRTLRAIPEKGYSVRITSYNVTTAEPYNIRFLNCNFQEDIDIVAGKNMRFDGCVGGTIQIAVNPDHVTTDYQQFGTSMVNLGDNTNWVGPDPRRNYIDLSDPGAELITNGADWTGATGATPPTGWTVGNQGTHTIFDSGDGAPYDVCLKLEHDTVNNNPCIQEEFPVWVNGIYEVSVGAKLGTAGDAALSLGSGVPGSYDYYAGSWAVGGGWTTKTFLITAVTRTLHIQLRVNTVVGGQFSLFDTVSVKKIPAVDNGDLFARGNIRIETIPIYANNAAAIAGGLKPGAFYRVNTAIDPEPIYIVH